MARSISRAAFRVLISIALVVTALAFRPTTTASANWLGTEKQLTNSTKMSHKPDISGTLVVYSDFRNARYVGNPEDPDTLFDIRLLDLRTGKERILTPKHSAAGDASISGKRIVWTDYGNGGVLAIWYHNLSTGTHKRLASGWQPMIDGTRLCYVRSNRIYVYNLTTRKEKAVSPKGANAGWCDISGTKVVYDRYTVASDFDVYLYDLATGKTTRLTADPARQDLARIDGSLVVWEDERNGLLNDDIYMYNRTTHTETRVTTASGGQRMPAVSAGRIVWEDDRNGWDNQEIYLYDVATGVETRVTNEPGWTGNVAISGNRIVYDDQRTGLNQVYLSTITPPVLKANAPKSVAKGHHPSVTGSLMAAGGVPIVGASVELQYSKKGTPWKAWSAAVTSVEGKFVLTGPAISRTTYLRARFAGNQDFAPAVSGRLTVRVG